MEKIEWNTFAVPNGYFKHYFFLMFGALWFFPMVLSVRFTMYGYILNYLWADFMFYMWYKTRKVSEEYWKQQKRKKDWQNDNRKDDDDESNRME